MEKSKKIYTKALNKYNNSEIDKAIELCEKSISFDLKNTASINLKGLLLYFTGDLSSAQKLWKMNSNVNKDSVAEKYLKDSKMDEERLKQYVKAVALINELKIREAIELLIQCRKSDFNSINVNNHLSICYIKTGEYDKALQCIDEVLKLDKKNSMAKENLNSLQELNIVKKSIFKNKYVKYIIAILAIASISLAAYYSYKNLNSKSKITFKGFTFKANNNKAAAQDTKNSKPAVEENKQIEKKAPEKKQEIKPFPTNEINKALSENNYEELFSNWQYFKGKELKINDKVIYSKMEEVLKKEGTTYFYKKGTSFISNNDLKGGIETLNKAYLLGEQSYLYPHIIYLMAVNYEAIGDVESSIKYYAEYMSKYPGGDYEQVVLYNLALIYKKIDINKAKQYAEKIISAHPNSIYNNSNIKEILK